MKKLLLNLLLLFAGDQLVAMQSNKRLKIEAEGTPLVVEEASEAELKHKKTAQAIALEKLEKSEKAVAQDAREKQIAGIMTESLKNRASYVIELDPLLPPKFPGEIQNIIKEYYISRNPLHYIPAVYDYEMINNYDGCYPHAFAVNARGTLLLDDGIYNQDLSCKAKTLHVSTVGVRVLRADDSVIVAERNMGEDDEDNELSKSLAYIFNSDGKLHKTLKGHTDYISSIVVKTDGTIFTGSYDGTVRMWSHDGEHLKTLVAGAQVSCLALGTDDLLVCGRTDGVCRFWNPLLTAHIDSEVIDKIQVNSLVKRGADWIVELRAVDFCDKGYLSFGAEGKLYHCKYQPSGITLVPLGTVSAFGVGSDGTLVKVFNDRIVIDNGVLEPIVKNLTPAIVSQGMRQIKVCDDGTIIGIRQKGHSELYVWRPDQIDPYYIDIPGCDTGMFMVGPTYGSIVLHDAEDNGTNGTNVFKQDADAISCLKKMSVWHLPELRELLSELQVLKDRYFYRCSNANEPIFLNDRQIRFMQLLPMELQKKICTFFNCHNPEYFLVNYEELSATDKVVLQEWLQKLSAEQLQSLQKELYDLWKFEMDKSTSHGDKRNYISWDFIVMLTKQQVDRLNMPEAILDIVCDYFNVETIEEFCTEYIDDNDMRLKVMNIMHALLNFEQLKDMREIVVKMLNSKRIEQSGCEESKNQC